MAIWKIPLQDAEFVIRLSNQAAGYAKRIHRFASDDWKVRFTPTPAIRRKCPDLPAEFIYRLIRYQVSGFRASWLLTSLMDPRQFGKPELVNLYHWRWRIETIYREWKHGLNIQNLRSHTPVGLLKEVYAQLLLSNLVRWVMTEATQNRTESPVDLSFLTGLSLVKNGVLRMLHAPPCHVPTLYQELLSDIRAAKIRQRPGRHYPRAGDCKVKNKGHGKYRLPSRLQKVKR
jgi:hypothetical protein